MPKTTYQAFCGSLLAGERKSDRPYECAIVLFDFNPATYRAAVVDQFYTAGTETTIKYFRSTLATPVGHHKPGRGYPVTADDHRQAADYLGDLTDEAILRRELARRLAQADEFIAKTQGVPSVLSWHMSAHNGQKALAAAQAKGYLRHWAMALVPASAKPVKARKAAQATSPSSVG
jgi:hypothetical protein